MSTLSAIDPTTDLAEFRRDTRAWLEANCPAEMRQPMTNEDDVCWGGRNVKFSSPAQRQWLQAMDLQRTTLYCQDWGGTIGLHLVANFPERFDRVVVSNSGIPLGERSNWFLKLWTTLMGRATRFPWIMFKPGFAKPISPAAYQAYRAPYPTPAYEKGLAKFPVLIAVTPDNPGVPQNRAAWAKLKTFDKPFLTLFGGKDMVARGADRRMQRHIPGAAGQAHAVMPTAAHFIQEDEPQWLVEHIVRFLEVGA